MSSQVTQIRPLTDVELGAWRGLLRTHAMLVKRLDAELEATHGLPLTSYEVLLHLADAPERKMRMCDVADSVLLSRSGLTRLIDRLERDGLVERVSCADDARGAFARLTDDGMAKLAVRAQHAPRRRPRALPAALLGRASRRSSARRGPAWPAPPPRPARPATPGIE